jgi:PII-like signaling protein
MNIPKDAVLLRIFFGEDDRFEHQPLYEAIVLKAREMHLAGATVLRGPMGFGHSSHLHTAKILRLSFDLPIVVEIVDTEMKIQKFLPVLDGMMASGPITMEKVQVLQYGKEGLRESRSLLEPVWKMVIEGDSRFLANMIHTFDVDTQAARPNGQDRQEDQALPVGSDGRRVGAHCAVDAQTGAQRPTA